MNIYILDNSIYLFDGYFFLLKDHLITILFISNSTIKWSIKDPDLVWGDSSIVHDDKYLYVINNGPQNIFKIDRVQKEIVQKKPFHSYANSCEIDRSHGLLYTCEWKKDQQRPYFLYQISTEGISTYNQIETPGPCWDVDVTDSGNKIWAVYPFASLRGSYIYIYDVSDLSLTKKIRVPFGTRTIEVDERSGFLFTASSATGIVEQIRLGDGEVVRRYKVGRSQVRDIELDTI